MECLLKTLCRSLGEVAWFRPISLSVFYFKQFYMHFKHYGLHLYLQSDEIYSFGLATSQYLYPIWFFLLVYSYKELFYIYNLSCKDSIKRALVQTRFLAKISPMRLGPDQMWLGPDRKSASGPLLGPDQDFDEDSDISPII